MRLQQARKPAYAPFPHPRLGIDRGGEPPADPAEHFFKVRGKPGRGLFRCAVAQLRRDDDAGANVLLAHGGDAIGHATARVVHQIRQDVRVQEERRRYKSTGSAGRSSIG